MHALAITIHKTAEGVEVEIAYAAADSGDYLVTRHPLGTSIADALTKLIPVIRARETAERKTLLSQPVKGSS